MRWLLLALLVSACDGGACLDPDLDGYGPGCEAGEDCDPDNASRDTDCDLVPPPDCVADPVATGCPCLTGGFSPCFDEQDGVGLCRAGRTTCIAGFWNVCEGGVGPISERCDDVDQDCDGLVDEGVLSPCGGCNSACRGEVWGPGPNPFEAGEGLALTRLGELTLATVEARFGTLWIANSGEGTLSRVDTNEAIETARYSSGGTEPSRVAVDFLGDAWIVNREFDGTSSVRKVAGDRARCRDADGDGLETSEGPADVRDDDECVLFHAPVGEVGGVGRAIAIDGDRGLDEASGGDAWIGLHDGEAIVELDGLTGEVRTRVELPGFKPYAATFDRWGTLNVIERDGVLVRIDVRASPPTVERLEVPFPCYLLYGLAADLEGRLLMSGFSCDMVFSYDPAIDRWEREDAFGAPRAVAFEGTDRFFVAHTAALVSEVSLAPLRVRRTLVASTDALVPVETIGVAIDALDRVWTVSSRSARAERGVATRIDPETEEVTAQLEVGLGPHVQGDLTGTRVRHSLVPEASATERFFGCGEDIETEWQRVHVSADAGSSGRVVVALRHAPDVAALETVPFATLGEIPAPTTGSGPPPWALDLPTGGVIEVRVTLSVDGAIGGPRLRRVGIEHGCPGPI